MNCRLFVIDVSEDRTNSKPSLRLWGVDDKNHRILVVLNSLTPYFYFVPNGDTSLTSIHDSITKMYPNVRVTVEDRKRLGRPVKSVKISCPDYNAMSECAKGIRKETSQRRMGSGTW